MDCAGLTWECALRFEGPLFKRFVINYRGVLGAFALVAGASIALGVIRDANDHTSAVLRSASARVP